MKVDMNARRANELLKPCIKANPTKGVTGHDTKALKKLIFIFATCSDREGPSFTNQTQIPTCTAKQTVRNSQHAGPFSVCRWQAVFSGNSVMKNICVKKQKVSVVVCVLLTFSILHRVFNFTCNEMDVTMESATVWKSEVRGSWTRQTMSPGCPRRSNRLRQVPIRLTSIAKFRVPPAAITNGVLRCLRSMTPTQPWQISSSNPASVSTRASRVSQDKMSKVGSEQFVLRIKDHWPSGHLVHWISSMKQRAS